jgi:putative ABC transport system substrate-binding protein
MKRREFITLAGGMAVWPLTARAQQNKRTRRVAILTPAAEDPEHERWFAAFVQELHDLGWIDGGNIQIDTHWATADVGRINRAAMEVIDRKPDVIVASGPLSVAALRPMTSTIPIVFTNVADPVGTGLVASLARPGGNITGFTLGEFAMSGKLLNVLKQVAPQVSRVTVIYAPQQVPQTVNECKPEGRYAFIFPQRNQAKDTAWRYLRRYAEPLLAKPPNESELRVDLVNGSMIVTWSLSRWRRPRRIC